MYATILVYKYSLTDAVNYKERELWLESYNINMECKRAIEERATTAFNTRELDLLIKDLVEKFGVERALYVLSKSVQENDWDTRFTEVVRDRSGVYDFHNEDEQQAEKTQGKEFYAPTMDLCGDNGAMIAAQGYYEFIKGRRRGIELNGIASLPIDFD